MLRCGPVFVVVVCDLSRVSGHLSWGDQRNGVAPVDGAV